MATYTGFGHGDGGVKQTDYRAEADRLLAQSELGLKVSLCLLAFSAFCMLMGFLAWLLN